MKKVFRLCGIVILLSGCRSFHGQLHNGTGEEIYIDVYDTHQRVVAFGELPNATDLSLSQKLNEISKVYYKLKSGHSCQISQTQIHSLSRFDTNGIWNIELNSCVGVGSNGCNSCSKSKN